MKLHLGCGKRYFPDWIHVDIADFDHIDYKAKIYPLDMFNDCVADIIYVSHAFEYFDDIEGQDVLKEWYRVLKPDGVLRLAVPDFEALIEVYKSTGNLQNIIGPLYGRMMINETMSIYHKTVYDFKKLERLLTNIGFKEIRRYDWKDTEHSAIDDHSQAYFPHMDKKNGRLVSLNVEAQKPSLTEIKKKKVDTP